MSFSLCIIISRAVVTFFLVRVDLMLEAWEYSDLIWLMTSLRFLSGGMRRLTSSVPLPFFSSRSSIIFFRRWSSTEDGSDMG